jgi:hypothetical protein
MYGSTLLLVPVGVRQFCGRFDGRLSQDLAQIFANTLPIANSSLGPAYLIGPIRNAEGGPVFDLDQGYGSPGLFHAADRSVIQGPSSFSEIRPAIAPRPRGRAASEKCVRAIEPGGPAR